MDDRSKRLLYMKEWRLRNIERQRRKEREYYHKIVLANPEKVRRNARDRMRRYRERNPRSHLKSRFGLTEADYQVMVKAQNNECAICWQPETAIQRGKVRGLCVDHSYETGEVRGLLCRDCNIALGKLKDSTQNAYRAAAYLSRHYKPKLKVV